MKIRSRFLLYLSIFFIIILSLGISAQLLSYRVFSRYLYGSVSEIFDATVGSFVQSIENVEHLSVSILSDPKTQSFLQLPSTNKNDFTWNRQRDALVQQLSMYTRTNPYIKEIVVIDANGNAYYGNIGSYSNIEFRQLIADKIYQKTQELQGKLLWSETGADTFPVVLSRQINLIGDYSRKSLGQVYILVDIDKLLDTTLAQIQFYDVKTLINFQGNQFFSHLGESSQEILAGLGVNRYATVAFKGEPHFAARVKVQGGKGWEFLFLIPASSLFEDLNRVNRGMYLLYGALFLLFAVLLFRFSHRITSPITALSKEMKLVDEKGFTNEKPLDLPLDASDEVKLLYHEFYQMINKIETLVINNLKQQIELNQAQMQALTNQLNPHFLYNTLDSLYWMAEMNGDSQMGEMIKSLSQLLRHSLQKADPLTSVEEQLAIINHYFFIQKIRFKERLEYHIDVDHQLYKTQIPRFTIQPLVENSIKYSLESSNDSCMIVVSIKRHGDEVKILIRDNGPGLGSPQATKSPGTGIGLANLRNRLNLLYGERGFLSSRLNEWGGTDMEVTIPYPKPVERAYTDDDLLEGDPADMLIASEDTL